MTMRAQEGGWKGTAGPGPGPCARFAGALAGALVLLAGLGVVVGCAGRTRFVDVDSQPGGAVLYVDGERRGQTRATVQLDFESDRVLLQMVKPGYRPVLQYWTWGEVPASDKKVFVLEVD